MPTRGAFGDRGNVAPAPGKESSSFRPRWLSPSSSLALRGPPSAFGKRTELCEPVPHAWRARAHARSLARRSPTSRGHPAPGGEGGKVLRRRRSARGTLGDGLASGLIRPRHAPCGRHSTLVFSLHQFSAPPHPSRSFSLSSFVTTRAASLLRSEPQTRLNRTACDLATAVLGS